uniref:Uncharacterized protein n=1 Tax=Plectus sambesii TaxID=2011161 RepID=A0A914WJC8_9BILA
MQRRLTRYNSRVSSFFSSSQWKGATQAERRKLWGWGKASWEWPVLVDEGAVRVSFVPPAPVGSATMPVRLLDALMKACAPLGDRLSACLSSRTPSSDVDRPARRPPFG